MPPDDDFQYQVFISYSSEDRPWAKKLCDDLRARGIALFFDQDRLEVGLPWRSQLRDSIDGSQHLIVLWSDHASKSDWVEEEYSRFISIVDPHADGILVPNQRLVPLYLEGNKGRLNRYQAINTLKRAGFYNPDSADKGLGQLDDTIWESMLDRIEGIVSQDDPSIRIPVAVLTLDQEALGQLDDTDRPTTLVPEFGALVEHMNIESRDALLEQYGDDRLSWKPFGGTDETIEVILDEFFAKLNRNDSETTLRWEPIEEAFFVPEADAVARVVALLSSGPSIIIIDPLALYDNEINRRLSVDMGACFENKEAIIMVLAPFSLLVPHHKLRELIRHTADSIYRNFFEKSPYMGELVAHCNPDISDKMELGRWFTKLRTPHLAAQHSRTRNKYLSMGGE